MSFNDTPPPDEVVTMARAASCLLYATLLFAPKIWQGAVVGCLGAVVIYYVKEGYAGGDMGGIYQIIGIPFAGAFGIVIGGGAAFAGQKIREHLFTRDKRGKLRLRRGKEE